jgi:hypothetical protein
VILWRDSVIFGENFSDGAILEVILLESRSKSSHLGCRVMIVKWHWHLDAFNGIIKLIIVLDVMLGICSCVTRMMQISGSTRLVPEVLCMFRHQLCIEGDITAAFLPHQV